MGEIVTLHNEVVLMTNLLGDTLTLIHHTTAVAAIKRLLHAHDILDLTLKIEREYQEFHCQPPWDKAAFQDLDIIRVELVSRFCNSFNPPTLLPPYYTKLGSLFSIMNLRL